MIFPWIEFTKDGRLHLFAMDTSLNPGQVDGVDHGLWNQVYFYSDDSGATWSPRFRLTPTSWDSFNDGTGGAKFLGDYQGVAVSEKAVWPVYPDTRTGEAEVYVNKLYNPIERPASCYWSVGTPAGGSLVSLFSRDGSLVKATPRTISNYGEATQLETAVRVPSGNPSSMKVCVWAGVNAANLEQRIELKNVLTGAWEAVDVRPAPTSITNTTAPVTFPTKYIALGLVRVRVVFKSVLRRPTTSWFASVDQDVLLVVP